MENALIKVQEAAQLLGVSRETIMNWGKRGILSLTHVGGNVLVTKESIDGIRESASKLVGQMQAVKALQAELEAQAKSCMEDIREYRLEKVLRKESAQRVNLYMEIFASLADLIYEGRYDEREYKMVVMFMKGASIDAICEEFQCSKQTVVNNIRKCNEILFNLQPYVRLQEQNREYGHQLKLFEKERNIMLSILEACRKDQTGVANKMSDEVFKLYFTPIEEMPLSSHTMRVLESSYMDCLGDLVHYGSRLQNLRGMGRVSLHEIKEVLATRYHLTLGVRIPGWESIRQAFDTDKDNVVYEKILEMDNEAKAYIDAALAELPEERVKPVKGVIQAMYSKGETYKKELEQYKSACEKLRVQIKGLERRLENREYFLSPAYEEVKELFEKLESNYEQKGHEPTPEGETISAERGMQLLECIFNQEVIQAESKRLQEDSAHIKKLEKDCLRLEHKLKRKEEGQKKYNEQRRALDKEREEYLAEEKKTLTAREAELRNEIEQLKKQNEELVENCNRKEIQAKVKEDMLKKELEWRKKVNEETANYYAKKYMKEIEAGEARMDLQHYEDLWNALKRYESQVDAFNLRAWYQKAWQKLVKFSDSNNRQLTLTQ